MNAMLSLTVVILMVAVGCEKAGPSGSSDATGETFPDGLFVSEPPSGARDVSEVRAKGSADSTVVVRGVVAGRKEPVAGNRAIFTLLDSAIRTCDQTPGDSCPNPWDACCETSETLAANTLAVRVVDASGQPLRRGLGDHIKPLQVVTVAATLRKSPDGVPILDATAIHSAPRQP